MSVASELEYRGRGRRPKALGERTHKRCPRCDTIKPLTEFGKRKNGKTPQSYCKPCNSKTGMEWYEGNKPRAHENSRRWRRENVERERELKRRRYWSDVDLSRSKAREWYRANQEAVLMRAREYNKRPEMQEKRRVYEAEKRALDKNFRIAKTLRQHLWHTLAHRRPIGSCAMYLGCSAEEAREHLERQFETGMSWDNWGRGDHGQRQWHVDHIRPLRSFDLTDEKQLAEACHFTNLRPVWSAENQAWRRIE